MAKNIKYADKRFFPEVLRQAYTNVHQAVYELLAMLIPGGTTGQVLAKSSNSDYDVEWVDPTTGIASARNGLEVNSGFVELGGILTKNTLITGDSKTYRIRLSDLFSFVVNNSDTINLEAVNDLGLGANSLFTISPPNLATSSINDVLTLLDPGSGECEWRPTRYQQSFVAGDWVANDITISAATHGRGINPFVVVLDSSGNVCPPGFTLGIVADVAVLYNILIDGSGNVTLTRGSADFDGQVFIM